MFTIYLNKMVKNEKVMIVINQSIDNVNMKGSWRIEKGWKVDIVDRVVGVDKVVTGCQLPDTSYRLPVTGYRLPDTSYQILDLDHCFLVLDLDHCFLVLVSWLLVLGPWFLVQITDQLSAIVVAVLTLLLKFIILTVTNRIYVLKNP